MILSARLTRAGLGWVAECAGEEGQECRRQLLAKDNQGQGLDYNQFSGRDKRTSTTAAPGYEGYATLRSSHRAPTTAEGCHTILRGEYG
jgi:hypothetical protein